MLHQDFYFTINSSNGLPKKITFLAESVEEKSFHKSCNKHTTKTILKHENTEEEKMVRDECYDTSTLESFPSSKTLKRAKPAGVSNNTNISGRSCKQRV